MSQIITYLEGEGRALTMTGIAESVMEMKRKLGIQRVCKEFRV